MLSFYLATFDTEAEKTKFEKLYYEYRLPMFYTAKRILQDDCLAEDARSRGFFACFTKLTQNRRK